MEQVQHSFQRYEKKFLLTQAQYQGLRRALEARLAVDQYGEHTICNIYFDTDRFDLIRASLEKPAYKEKFRLRSYGVPGPQGLIFAEIKKKAGGVVYKRRVEGLPRQSGALMARGRPLPGSGQIQREIQWFLSRYRPTPKVFIGYERVAMTAPQDPDLRVTFDWNIRWRTQRLELGLGDDGHPVLSEDRVVMEIKVPRAIPLWLAGALSAGGIFPTSFSKYGACYQRCLLPQYFSQGRNAYA